jgi:hypothetical protein
MLWAAAGRRARRSYAQNYPQDVFESLQEAFEISLLPSDIDVEL